MTDEFATSAQIADDAVSDLVPFPTLPPPPADPGEYLTYFTGHIEKYTFDREGQLQFTITVTAEDKYRALPLTDIRGRVFNLTVHANRSRRPLVSESGVLAVYEGRQRVNERQAERVWRRVRRTYFEGTSDDE